MREGWRRKKNNFIVSVVQRQRFGRARRPPSASSLGIWHRLVDRQERSIRSSYREPTPYDSQLVLRPVKRLNRLLIITAALGISR